MAQKLCEFGEPVKGYAESFLLHFYEALDELEASMRGKRAFVPFARKEYDKDFSNKELRVLQDNLKHWEETIVGIFLDAVKNHDGKMIVDLAQGVWFFKDKRLPNRAPADRERSIMISLKMLLDESGQKITVRMLAEFLALEAKASGNKFEISEDGFSALRRKCKEMDFPLVEARKGKKK